MNVLALVGAAVGFVSVAAAGFVSRSSDPGSGPKSGTGTGSGSGSGATRLFLRLFPAVVAGAFASQLGAQPIGSTTLDPVVTGIAVFAVAFAASFAGRVARTVGTGALFAAGLLASGDAPLLGTLAVGCSFGASVALVLLRGRADRGEAAATALGEPAAAAGLGPGLGHVGAAAAVIAALAAFGSASLPTSYPTGVPTVVGVAACAVLALAGLRRMTKGRRVARVGVGIALLGLVGAGGAVSIAGVGAALKAQPHAERAITLAEGALGSAESLRTEESAAALDSAAAELRTANAALDTSTARMARSIPVLGQNLRAVSRLTTEAEALSVRGAAFARNVDLSKLRPTAGRVDLSEFRRLTPEVRSLRDPVRALLTEQVRATKEPWIASPLRDRVTSLSVRLNKLDRDLTSLDSALTVLPGLLGGDGPRRYLLVLPTTAEARGSGGLIGNFGEITANDGELSLVKFGRNIDLQQNGRPLGERTLDAPADYVARYTRFGAAYTWSNMNMSPDYPSAAQAMANLYPQSGGTAVDGVISVDPVALASFLELLGPIDVPSWPEPITSANAAEILLHRSYVELGDKFKERLVVLADVANGVWAKLLGVSLPEPARLADVFSPVARSRHLQLWSRVPAEQAYFARIGADGAVPVVAGDAFGVVVNNAGGNKIDWFLKTSTDYDVTLGPAGKVDAVATVTLRNDAPTSGLPDYVIGSATTDEVIPKGSNRMYVSVYSVLPLTSWTITGKEVRFQTERELGRNVASAWIVLPSGLSAAMDLRFSGSLPVDADAPYRLDVFRQPLVSDAPVSVTVHDGSITSGPFLASSPGTLTVTVPR